MEQIYDEHPSCVRLTVLYPEIQVTISVHEELRTQRKKFLEVMIVKLDLYGWVGYKQINVESCLMQEQRGGAGR